MRYSISVELPSGPIRAEMLNFLRQQDWEDLAKRIVGDYVGSGEMLYPERGEVLPYAPDASQGAGMDPGAP